eukprot:Polyplicarium_translucidae@DN872_c0_g1_i1.p1
MYTETADASGETAAERNPQEEREALKKAFEAFAGGTEMDGRQFVKMLRDAKVLDPKFTTTQADLVFAKAKQKGHRKLHMTDFDTAVTLMAQKKGVPKDAIAERIATTGGPIYVGTKAEAVRFYAKRSSEGKTPETKPVPASAAARKPRTQAPQGGVPDSQP